MYVMDYQLGRTNAALVNPIECYSSTCAKSLCFCFQFLTTPTIPGLVGELALF